jgi:hypothetical protein
MRVRPLADPLLNMLTEPPASIEAVDAAVEWSLADPVVRELPSFHLDAGLSMRRGWPGLLIDIALWWRPASSGRTPISWQLWSGWKHSPARWSPRRQSKA